MKLGKFLVAMAATCVLGSAAQAAIIVPFGLQTTNADMNATDTDLPTPSPLAHIDLFSAAGAGTGIYTNQTDGVAGVSGGIRTVVAAALQQATDGIQYTNVRGPNGGPLIAFLGLEGSFEGPGSVRFSEGKLIIAELAGGGFQARDPSTWITSGAFTVLETFDIAMTSVSSGPLGDPIGFVPASLMNLSQGDGLTVGNTDYNLLFIETPQSASNPQNFLDDYRTLSGLPGEVEGVFLEGEQDLVFDARGLQTSGGVVLDNTDLGILNNIAALAGLGDLGGLGTGWATALGAASVMSTDYFADPDGLQGGTGSGDLFATSAEANFRPVVDAVPEPSSLLVLGGLFGLVAARRRARRS